MRRRRGDASPDAFLFPFTSPPLVPFFLRRRVPEARTRWRAPQRAARAWRWAGDTPGTPRWPCLLPYAPCQMCLACRLGGLQPPCVSCVSKFYAIDTGSAGSWGRTLGLPVYPPPLLSRCLCRSTLTLLGAPVYIRETRVSRSLGCRQDRGPGGRPPRAGTGPHVGWTLPQTSGCQRHGRFAFKNFFFRSE